MSTRNRQRFRRRQSKRRNSGTSHAAGYQALELRRLLSGTPGPDGDPNDQICEVDIAQPILTAGNFEDGAVGGALGLLDVDLYPILITRTGIEHTFTADNRAGSTVDTYLRLFDASGVELADDDDSGTSNNGPGDNAEINYTFSTAGTYYLGVSAASNTGYDVNTGTGDSTGNSTGAFRLTFHDDDDEIDEALTTLQDGFAAGVIDPDTDVDLFRFDAVGGQTFRIDVDGSNGLDAFLVIFDDNGNQLAADDNSGPGVDAEFTATFPTTDVYYIGVSNTGNRNYDANDGTGDTAGAATGTYTITATEVSLDDDDRVEGAIDLGNLFTQGTRSASDAIDSDTDVDLYKFEVGRNGSYVEIDVDVPTFGVDTLIRLFNSNGDEIANNEDANAPGESGAFPRDSFIGRNLTQGVWYVGVSASGNSSYNHQTGLGDTDGGSTGTYTIEIQDRLHVDTISDISTTGLTQNNLTNSLREAIEFANDESGSQTITFKPSLFSSPKIITVNAIAIGSDQLEITDSLVIDGPGADLLSISAEDDSRVVLVDNGDDNTEIDVTIRGVTIRDGNTSAINSFDDSEPGAGIRNSENLTLQGVAVVSNRSDRFTDSFGGTDAGKNGGGLLHRRGTLTITESLFSDNSALNGGGIRIDSGAAEIINSTFSGNTTRGNGGGLSVNNSSTTVTVRSSTITGNRANDDNSGGQFGGGIVRVGGSVTLHNTIVAGNFRGTGASETIDDTDGTMASASSHNLIGEQDSGSSLNDGVNGNIVGNGAGGSISVLDIFTPIVVNPSTSTFEAVLADNGGTTLTHALAANSPAVHAGDNSQLLGATTDQTGGTRVRFGTVDIGAVESDKQAPGSLVVTTNSDVVNPADGQTSLREAIQFANDPTAGNAADGDADNDGNSNDTISFAPGLSGQTITLTGGQLPVTASLTVTGPAANALTISGNDASRIFLFGSSDAATYKISDVTLTDGSVPRGTEPNPDTGGAIKLSDPDDTLIIERSVISDSEANGGGAIFIGGNGATLRVIDSALINNEANFSGSAILTGGSTDVTIVNSTISGNVSLNDFGTVVQQTAGNENASMLLRNVTLASNTGRGLQILSGVSGDTSTISVGNSILSNNILSDGTTKVNFSTTGGGTTTLASLGHNLSDDATIEFNGPNDQTSTDPMLTTLDNRGGPTPTHGLQAGSLAINQGNNALALDLDGNTLLNDQRGTGFDRIRFGTVDIGALESSIDVVATAPTIVAVTRDGGGVLSRPDLITTFAVTFNQNVNVSQDDLFVLNETTGAFVDTSGAGLSYDANSLTATWNLSSLMLDAAFYTFQLSSDISAVAGGMFLDGNGDGTGGDNRDESVYVAIPGDANLDGTVDVFGDGFTFLNNIGITAGATWAQGDFDGNGKIDVFGDGFRLLNSIGQSVVPPATSLAATSFILGGNLGVVDDAEEESATSRDSSRDAAFAEELFLPPLA